jgi:hypothetical protein
MLNEDVQIVDVDPEHWLNLIRLTRGDFTRRGEQKKPPRERRGSLRVLVENGRTVKALHSRQGVLAGYQAPVLDDAKALAEAEGADQAMIIERGAPRRLMHRIQSRLTLEMNYVEQVFIVLEEVRAELGQGLRIHPRPKIPKLAYAPIASVVKGVLPANELIVIAVYSDDGKIRDSSGLPIVMSLIIRFNSRGEIDLITTTDSLIAAGLRVEQWDRDCLKVNELAAKVWGNKVFVGVHIPLSSMSELAYESAPKRQGPKALLSLRKAGKLMLEPFPLRFRAMLSMGGMFKL